MSATLEQRVEALERKIAEFAHDAAPRPRKNWQKTLGFSRGDEGFDDLVEKGREYRQGLSEGTGCADS